MVLYDGAREREAFGAETWCWVDDLDGGFGYCLFSDVGYFGGGLCVVFCGLVLGY